MSIPQTTTDNSNKRKNIIDRVANWIKSDDNSVVVTKQNKSARSDKSIDLDYEQIKTINFTKYRVSVMNILWGKDSNFPGNEAFTRKLFNPEVLNSKSMVLDLSSGLGACARTITAESFAKIDVIQNDKNLLPFLEKSIREHELAPFLSILKNNMNVIELAKVKYDFIYGRECFFKIKNKQRAFEQCADSLKTNGRIIFTDFVLEKDMSSYTIFKNWSEQERSAVYPTTMANYLKMFEGLGFKIGPIEDYSEEYVDHVNSAWLNFKKYVSYTDLDERFMNVMLLEGDIWLSRVRALRSKKLKLLRFQLHL